MSSIFLYNTLTREKEKFEPLTEGSVSMYSCGPTVYDYAHIGNLRSFVFSDTLRRMFELNSYEVKQVVNITDVGQLVSDGDLGEDKMTKGLKREGMPITLDAMRELAERYTTYFLDDLDALNVERPSVLPKASEHIEEDIALIKRLTEKEFAYTTSDGVYFDTSRAKDYGKLAKLDLANLKEGARIEANPDKRNPTDFALWKFNTEMGWESPWGKGFPGWHIECSAMGMKYLGETFDIHTGGTDLAPVHHTNEIAQSEAATGKTFVRYWLHSAFVNVEGGKMAKSEGNFLRLQSLVERGIHPLAYRYWLQTAHYRSQVNFSWEALDAAQTALLRLARQLSELPDGGEADQASLAKLTDALNDDLDTPKAVALIWDAAADTKLSPSGKKATIAALLEALGIPFQKLPSPETVALEDLPDDVRKLLETREAARREKRWDEADRLRDELRQRGFEVSDTEEGPSLTRA